MSSYKLEYKLKQQTPMIHFQYDQSGATLRATEVKPKLDRFIRSKCNVDDSWLIGCEDGDKKALNYKLRISVVPDDGFEMKDCVEISDKIDRMYFGNMGLDEDDENRRKTVFYYSDKCKICLTVICFIPELLKVIDENIAEFFAITNFGTRQSKGFGGFSLIKGEEESYGENKIVNRLTDKYKFFYVQADCKKDTFPLANSIYTTMKSGIDRPDKKTKVNGYLLTQYLYDNEIENIGTDKDLMKEKLLQIKNGRSKYEDYLFVRALLGLTDTYEFKLGKRKGKIKVEGSEKDEDGKAIVQRFPSPVTIKIVGKTILFIFNEELFDEIKGKNFNFSLEKNKNTDNSNGKPEVVHVPASFNVDYFIGDFVYYYNEEDEYDKNSEYRASNITNIKDKQYAYKYKKLRLSRKAGGK